MPIGLNTQIFLNALSQNKQSAQSIIEKYGIEGYRKLAEEFFSSINGNCLISDIVVENMVISGPESLLDVTFYRPKNRHSLMPVMIYFPGGAGVINLKSVYDLPCGTMAKIADCVVIKVNCRLSPEYNRLDAFADAYFATKYFYDNWREFNLDQERFSIGGNSSGSTLAAYVTNTVSLNKQLQIKHQLLITPSVDLSLASRRIAEYKKFSDLDIMLPLSDQEYLTNLTLCGVDYMRTDPRISPLFGINDNVPKTTLIYGEYDALLGDAIALEQELKIKMGERAQTDLKIYKIAGQIHNAMIAYSVLSDGPYQAEIAGICLRDVFC